MLDFKLIKQPADNSEWIETSLHGKALLTIPQLNKGTAFTQAERLAFGLLGKLPICIDNLEEQSKRVYLQYQAQESVLQKHIYLNNLHNKNHVLFYKLVSDHLVEMLPLIYTPVVGTAVKEFSREFRQARGLYLAYPDRDYIDEMLDNRSNPEVDLIVITDGEGVLGIGDQGIGSMDIPIAKLMVYTLCGGINPTRTLPICLDVGTDNEQLLQDPLYLGWRHARIRGQEYATFVAQVIAAIQRKFPSHFLHWEDFGRATARDNLERFRYTTCTFNDDIQGTGAVTLAALLAAVKATRSSLTQQRIIIFGAGTAGTGIADQICAALVRQGLTATQARQQFWLIDRDGLITTRSSSITSAQAPYARAAAEGMDWPVENSTNRSYLAGIIHKVKPTVLIGCSSVGGAFTEEVVKAMTTYTAQPIIFALSNPTENSEAHPADLLNWTAGKALLATGSPFVNIVYAGREVIISQCNNALVYPGIGLGVLAAKATRLTDNMLWAACSALSECSPTQDDVNAPLLPALQQGKEVSRKIAQAVAQQAVLDGVALRQVEYDWAHVIDEMMWVPHYVPFHRT